METVSVRDRRLRVGLWVGVPVEESVGVCEGVLVALGEAEGVSVSVESVAVALWLRVGVTENVRLPTGDGVLVGVGLGDREQEPECDVVSDPLRLSDCEAVPEAVGLRVPGDAVLLAVSEADKVEVPL